VAQGELGDAREDAGAWDGDEVEGDAVAAFCSRGRAAQRRLFSRRRLVAGVLPRHAVGEDEAAGEAAHGNGEPSGHALGGHVIGPHVEAADSRFKVIEHHLVIMLYIIQNLVSFCSITVCDFQGAPP